MPQYLNLSVALRYDFIVTYLMVLFFIYWILAKLRINRLSEVFRQVWQRRNRQVHRIRSWPVQKPNRE